ncbi:type II toxin-antitoxin system RelE/ParE family toxin [Marinomonas sp. UCMA 3892]|uniref:type II toxin-antitoxin system RelE/ParE family toxin n=1 Tax=Marinomonas sp. UCMA 3892 TaxID=1972585 RepID=UPI00146F4DB5|nr:type II toxin-antitoxin system RelE/ParE family toxin [Marinomonas sp. UCMA 3892]NLU97028.1 type II toxin-antitoxin system RelE/ParE family toxin [Marinomonas sp. UCMA 3892]
MFRLSITPKAESDLIGIWVYICEEWGVDQADTYIDQLETEMKQLMNHPSLGTNYAHVFPGYRRLLLEHHAVFYQVLETEILVVRILHEEMDAPERLLD